MAGDALLRFVRVRVLEAGTVGALETAVNSFLDGAGEARLITVRYGITGSNYSALIVYSQE